MAMIVFGRKIIPLLESNKVSLCLEYVMLAFANDANIRDVC